MMKNILFLILAMASPLTSHAAIYNCVQNSPNPSLFFDRKVKIECDLDFEAKPKFVVLAGSNKIALNQKAHYYGSDIGKQYEKHLMTALDGQVFEIHTASRMFTETAEASFFTVEPDRHSAFWICRIED